MLTDPPEKGEFKKKRNEKNNFGTYYYPTTTGSCLQVVLIC